MTGSVDGTAGVCGLLTIGELSPFPGNWGPVRVSIHVHHKPKWVVLCDWSDPAPSEMRLDAMAGLFRPCVDLAGFMADACRNRSDEASGCEACRFRPFPCAHRPREMARRTASLPCTPPPPHPMPWVPGPALQTGGPEFHVAGLVSGAWWAPLSLFRLLNWRQHPQVFGHPRDRQDAKTTLHVVGLSFEGGELKPTVLG